MSRARIYALYAFIDLLTEAGVVWCAMVARWPVAKYLIPAAALFVLAGVWLIVMTVRSTPPGSS
jgi:hypothetical protein